MGGDVGLSREEFTEMLTGFGCDGAGGFDFFVSCGAAEFFGEGDGDGFGIDEAASEVEVLFHAGSVDLEIWSKCGEVMKSARREANDFGERRRFCVPGAQASLVILRLDGEDCGNESGDTRGGGQDGGTRDRILFVRHCGGSAAAGGMWLGKFGDFGLHVKRKVVGDFIERAGEKSVNGRDFGDAIAMGVPWGSGQGKRKFFGEIFCDDGSIRTKGSERAGSAAELEYESMSFECK